jgi:hypothetical protein
MVRLAFSVLGAFLAAGVVPAQTRLPTVDEAIELSQKTGRPIFAMAGQKT